MAEDTCPGCGESGSIDVQALVWVRITEDGSDADEARHTMHEFDDDSPAYCDACDWRGHYGDVERDCGQCDGEGTTQSASNGEDEPCPVCDGSGRITPNP